MATKYYDGAKLLSLLDLEKKVPEIFFSATNRSAGKTTFFDKMILRRFMKHSLKFIILVRYNYECDGAIENFLSASKTAGYYTSLQCHGEPRAKGKYYENFIGDKPCGYTISLSDVDFIKKRSSLFSDGSCIVMDEVLPESKKYLPGEFDRFMSIHTSLSRGGGKQKKYLPVYMISNLISVINPYFQGWGISDKIPQGCTFFRWYGAVFEFGYNESAADAQKESGVMRAARGINTYASYAQEKGKFLADNYDMIEKMTGRSHYWCTLKDGNKKYGCKIFDSGYMYIDKKPDLSYSITVANKRSMDSDVYLSGYMSVIKNQLHAFYGRGAVRFKDLECKEAFLTFV